MTESAGTHRGRQRRGRPEGEPAADRQPSAPPRNRARRRDADAAPDHSKLGVSGALRARDVNRPTDEDLAEAEASVQLVRRHWHPS